MGITDDTVHNSGWVDLEKAAKTATSRRENAWKLLKQTRNPEYVGLRYGYPIENMRAALKTFDEKKE